MKYLLLALLPLLLQAQQFENPSVSRQSPPRWTAPDGNYALIGMFYEEDSIRSCSWKPKMGTPTHLYLIYTAYPADTTDWLTPFSTLNGNRLRNAYALDKRLKDIPLTLIAQSGPQNGEEAATYFHGISIAYLPNEVKQPIAITVPTEDSLAFIPYTDYSIDSMESVSSSRKNITDLNMDVVLGIVEKNKEIRHPVVLRALERNTQWDSLLLVIDWTGSMYEYGAQVMRWYQDHRHRIQQLVRFNDGNDFLYGFRNEKNDGEAGGIYYVYPDSLPEVLAAMRYVMNRGTGGDIPENNLEALLKAHQQFPGHGDVVMIADNNSAIRDYSLLDSIDFPVHIIVCDKSAQDAIQVRYFSLAWRTGGSIQTMNRQLQFTEPRQAIPSEGIRFNGHSYYLRDGSLILH